MCMPQDAFTDLLALRRDSGDNAGEVDCILLKWKFEGCPVPDEGRFRAVFNAAKPFSVLLPMVSDMACVALQGPSHKQSAFIRRALLMNQDLLIAVFNTSATSWPLLQLETSAVLVHSEISDSFVQQDLLTHLFSFLMTEAGCMQDYDNLRCRVAQAMIHCWHESDTTPMIVRFKLLKSSNIRALPTLIAALKTEADFTWSSGGARFWHGFFGILINVITVEEYLSEDADTDAAAAKKASIDTALAVLGMVLDVTDKDTSPLSVVLGIALKAVAPLNSGCLSAFQHCVMHADADANGKSHIAVCESLDTDSGSDSDADADADADAGPAKRMRV